MVCSLVCLAGSEEQTFCASTLPSRIPSVRASRSRCVPHEPLPPLPDGEPGFLPQLVPGTVAGKGGPPGFPTLRTLQLTPQLKMAGVDVLGQPSKRESLILTIEVRPPGSWWLPLLLLCLAALHRASVIPISQPSVNAAAEHRGCDRHILAAHFRGLSNDVIRMVLRGGCDNAQAGRQAGAAGASASQVAKGLLKQRVWIKWPYLQEAVIQAVSDADRKVGTPQRLYPYTPD